MPGKTRVLFVDDEPNVLRGLERMLYPLRNEWEMVFTESGEAALAVLEQTCIDVIVSDMRMPGLDGIEFFSEVRERYPHIVRIILSGYCDSETILRSVSPVHQYLSKPCDAETLRDTVLRASALRELLTCESLKNLVTRIETLPSLPSLYMEVIEELQSPDASIQKLGEIISKDLAMTAKILQLVNSSFFGFSRHISNPAFAVNLLGLETIKALVLTIGVFSRFEEMELNGFSLDSLWSHSRNVGAAARRISLEEKVDVNVTDDALMAGMLHDVGKLVLAAKVPETYSTVLSVASEERISLWKAEYEILGTSHAEMGAYLLGLWGLPGSLVEALAYHHCPERSLDRKFSPLTAVHIADSLENEGHETEMEKDRAGMNSEYLERLNLTEHLHLWREKCLNTVMERDSNG